MTELAHHRDKGQSSRTVGGPGDIGPDHRADPYREHSTAIEPERAVHCAGALGAVRQRPHSAAGLGTARVVAAVFDYAVMADATAAVLDDPAR
ncbi:hypothetical protein ACIBEK_29780 [Nocardia fusca]|uniref:hypothetical protein n=1 Tax=Nocardia fusca TaxID=941183 RepID=UPI0037A566B4